MVKCIIEKTRYHFHYTTTNMFNNTYQPFTTLFLLPDEIKANCGSLKDLIKDKSIISGEFTLETPKTSLGF